MNWRHVCSLLLVANSLIIIIATRHMHGSMLSSFSRVQLFVTTRTVAHQASLSLGFSRQEYWSGLPCPPAEDLPDPGIEPAFLKSPALAGRFFFFLTTSATWEVPSTALRLCKYQFIECSQPYELRIFIITILHMGNGGTERLVSGPSHTVNE